MVGERMRERNTHIIYSILTKRHTQKLVFFSLVVLAFGIRSFVESKEMKNSNFFTTILYSLVYTHTLAFLSIFYATALNFSFFASSARRMFTLWYGYICAISLSSRFVWYELLHTTKNRIKMVRK